MAEKIVVSIVLLGAFLMVAAALSGPAYWLYWGITGEYIAVAHPSTVFKSILGTGVIVFTVGMFLGQGL
jgi:hypothetical protein